LIVAPLVAACGLPVAKMSGRGLGHTGGTIDKLSAIPGFRAEMSQTSFLKQVQKIGISIISQTGDLVPADKKLYALRDVTATVDSIPLIASSIMSKKIASGAKGIVLDVKYGSGAFMSSVKEAEELAQNMVAIGKNLGRDTVAVLSNMEQPLGNAVGNSIEVLEAIDSLQGRGPSDLMEVSLELASWMLLLGKKANSLQEARLMLEEVLDNRKAWDKFLEFIAAQGGDTDMVSRKKLLLAPLNVEFKATQTGYIESIDARKIGISAMILGAGRETKDSKIDFGAGILLLKKRGDLIIKDEPILCFYTSSADRIQPTFELLTKAIKFSDNPPSVLPMVTKVIF
jgi:pyrimidine-nucleoside phosphorylase